MENRIFKFRAWDEQKKTMHDNFQFIKSGEDGNDWILFVSDKQPISDYEKWSKNPYFQQQLKIMQLTGLKDKNGKEIYEGDILNKKYHNLVVSDGIGVVEMGYGDDSDGYNHGGWYGWKCGESSLSDVNEKVEVIGNIYENPELLQTK